MTQETHTRNFTPSISWVMFGVADQFCVSNSLVYHWRNLTNIVDVNTEIDNLKNAVVKASPNFECRKWFAQEKPYR